MRRLRRRSRAARPSLRVDRWSLPATVGRDGWSPRRASAGQDPAYRLTRPSPHGAPAGTVGDIDIDVVGDGVDVGSEVSVGVVDPEMAGDGIVVDVAGGVVDVFGRVDAGCRVGCLLGGGVEVDVGAGRFGGYRPVLLLAGTGAGRIAK